MTLTLSKFNNIFPLHIKTRNYHLKDPQCATLSVTTKVLFSLYKILILTNNIISCSYLVKGYLWRGYNAMAYYRNILIWIRLCDYFNNISLNAFKHLRLLITLYITLLGAYIEFRFDISIEFYGCYISMLMVL